MSSKAALAKAEKKREQIVALIKAVDSHCEDANAFFDDFSERMKKPYKALRYAGEPVAVKNENAGNLRECTDIGIGKKATRFDSAVSEAKAEHKAAYSNPDNVEFKPMYETVKKYKAIFDSLAASKETAKCGKFRRLFTSLKEKMEDLSEKVRAVYRELKGYEEEKEVDEVVSYFKAVVNMESKASGAVSTRKGGGRRMTRRRGKKRQTRRS